MINHRYKFVFTHIPKTAGSTVLRSLSDMGNFSHQQTRHIPMLKELDDDVFAWKYFKFAFVRNPWDRAVSLYSYRKKVVTEVPINFNKNKRHSHWPDFDEILNTDFRGVVIKNGTQDSQWLEPSCSYWITDSFNNSNGDTDQPHGKSIANFIGKFENLQEDFNFVCDKIGIPRQKLPHHNKSKHKHYTEYYDDETREIIAEKYKKDIETFGYKFGE